MGLTIAVLAAASVLSFVQGRAQPDGGYAEPGGRSTVGLTATAVLALSAAGAQAPDGARAYLTAHETGLTATELELATMAEAVTGGASPALLASLHSLDRSSGAIGPTVNSTIWGMLALRQAAQPVTAATVRYVEAAQARSGGFSWATGIPPDNDDTAAAVEALAAAGVRGSVLTRALAYLRARETKDGGFELQPGTGSNVQSTAWSIQAFLAAGAKPPGAAFRYLARMTRTDGSLRYSARYATTPLWVSAQALPALLRKPFPLR
jgi:iron complex transport system substrate-binding protein